MKIVNILALVLLAGCSDQMGKFDGNLQEDDRNTLYAIGVEISQQVKVLGLNEQELNAMLQGFSDNVLKNDLEVDLIVYRDKIQEWGSKRLEAAADRFNKEGQEYIAELLKEPGVVETVSGALVKSTSEGEGENPTGSSTVKIHYHGTLVDGTVFDSSKDRGEPAEFALGGLIKCWGEGIPKIKVGGSAILVCPPDTAYGENGSAPVIPPNATLIFEVELLEIVKG